MAQDEEKVEAHFTAHVNWVEIIGQRKATAVAIGVDVRWLVEVDILTIEKPLKPFDKKGKIILAVHSPVMLFAEEHKDLPGKSYSLKIFGVVKDGRTAWYSAQAKETGPQAKPAVGKVESCEFATQSLPPAFRVPKQYADGYKLFQAAGAIVPEEVTVKSVILMGDSRSGLTPEATKRLSAGLDQLYRSIAADSLLRKVKSALPYCLADKRPAQGHYFAYYPEKVSDDTQVLVFLHGFGGNFLFYTYLLKEEFPEAVILLPSWSGSWHDGTMEYLDDMYKDVKRRKSLTIRKPCLLAISAGGPAGFRLYNQQPERFSCYVSIASAPSRAIVPALKKELNILMVNGKADSGFPIAGVQSIAAQLAQRLPHFQIYVLDGDHFFLLSHREETFRVIRGFLRVRGKRDGRALSASVSALC